MIDVLPTSERYRTRISKRLPIILGFAFSFMTNVNGEETSEPVKILQSWEGKCRQSTLQSRAPRMDFISDATTWKYLWRSLIREDAVPKVDFATHLVLMAVMSGPNRLDLRPTITSRGEVRFIPSGTMVGGPGFGYRFDLIERKGIQSINGIPISQNGFINVRLIGKLNSRRDETWTVTAASTTWSLNFGRRPWLLEKLEEMNGKTVYLAGAIFKSAQSPMDAPWQISVDVLSEFANDND
jgi:hypothetical protein